MNTFIRKQAAGFTLLELLVVLTILALLAGLVGPQVMKHVGSANSKTARLQVEDFSASLDMFRLDVGRYPTTAEGLQALVERPGGTDRWNGPYLKKSVIPKDPWGNEYHYQSPGQHAPVDIYSLGADNAPGGDGEGQDILSWQ